MGIFSFVGLSDSDHVSYPDTWNLQSNFAMEPTTTSSGSGGYMGNVGTEGQTDSYTLEEALELQSRRIESAETNPASGSGTPYQNTNDKTIGLAVGGAQDINNFRKNIENNYLPLHTDITYEGLFYDYYFDTGNKQECSKLFCPSYSYAVSKDPFSEKDEYYLSVGLNSGLKQSDFERKKLNLVVVLDVSGSMDSPFNRYHYDQYGNRVYYGNVSDDYTKSKIKVATESLASLIDNLNDDDKLSIVLFSNNAHLSKPLESMETTDKEQLKKNILQIYASGGTNMASGIQMGTSQFDEMSDSNQFEYENRIIFLTDAMPNIGETRDDGLFGMIKDNADKNIHTTVIGIGVDFNTELTEQITKVSGANYYSVHSSLSFEKRMVDEFDFMVTPLVFDLVLSLDADGYVIDKVYGSPESNESTGEIMRVNTLFPSKVEGGETKGGIVILKLEKISDDGTINLKTNYKDRMGQTDGNTITIDFSSTQSDFYENPGIHKGIILARYAELMQTWVFDERMSHVTHDNVLAPKFFYGDGIHIPDYVGNSLGRWERQSIPLQVSGEYAGVIVEFNDYFKEQIISIEDYDLLQEVMIMQKLEDHT
ncbi:MAG: VWA domain-containing protein [Nitrosopumilus sp.]|nr:MAG: VWA domain-containing protein [Nitrosopumilus sp.]